MKIVVLDRNAIGEDTPLDGLLKFGDTDIYNKTDSADIIERLADADVAILNKVKITRDVVASSKKLKLVCVFATGYDNIDIDACREYAKTRRKGCNSGCGYNRTVNSESFWHKAKSG